MTFSVSDLRVIHAASIAAAAPYQVSPMILIIEP